MLSSEKLTQDLYNLLQSSLDLVRVRDLFHFHISGPDKLSGSLDSVVRHVTDIVLDQIEKRKERRS